MKSFLPFLIIGLCIGMYFMYISPWVVEIQESRSTNAEYVSILEKAKEVEAKRNEITTKYSSISQENLALIRKVIPDKFDQVIFANDINALAIKNNLEMKSIKDKMSESVDSIDTSQVEKKYKTTTIAFSVSGQYKDFLSFMKEIESSLQLIDVIDLIISFSSPVQSNPNQRIVKNNNEQIGDYSLEVQVYSLQ